VPISKYHYIAVFASPAEPSVHRTVYADSTTNAFTVAAAHNSNKQLRSIEITSIESLDSEIGQLITDPINQTPPEFGFDSNKIYGVD